MKKVLSFIFAVCILLSCCSLPAAAEEYETIEYEGKTYINVDKKEVLDKLIYDMIENREEFLDVYCYHDKRDWADEYPRNISNFIDYENQTVFDYMSYTVGSTSLYTYPKYGDTGFTIEAYGTIEIRYLDTKEETAKADAIINGVLAKISSYSLVDKLQYIANYVCGSTEYGSVKTPTGGYDMINGACDVLTGVRTNTVCTSYAVTFQRFMELANIPCYMISNRAHIWNVVEIDGLWYGIDCTSDQGDIIDPGRFLMGLNTMKSSYSYGKLDAFADFSKTHTFATEDYGKETTPEPTPEVPQTPSEPEKPSAPVSSKPVSSKPVESKPVESEPVESEPVESEPETSSSEVSTPDITEVSAELKEETKVDAELFKSAADAGVPLKLKSENYSWTFKSLIDYTSADNFDAAILRGDEVSKSDFETIKKAAKTDSVYPFSFAFHGELPAKATVSIKVDDIFSGKTVDIYSINESDEPVLEQTVAVSSDATLTFDTTHCSLWYISEAIADDTATNPPSLTWLWIVLAVVVLGLLAVVIILFIKNKKITTEE